MNSKMPFYWIPGDRWPDVDSEEAHLGELYRDVMTIDPEILIGHIFDFYGAHSNQFKIDDLVLEALEYPED